MKAMRISDYGAPLQIEEVAVPQANEGEVLVENFFTGMNGVDPGRAFGFLKQVFPLEFPWTPGGDVAGRVAAVGSGVTQFKVGDEVFGYTRAGGAYAQYVVVNAASLAHRPEAISEETAAGIALVGQTATQMLELAEVSAGKTVLILGAGGAVGTLAIQLAKLAGAHVIATARGNQKAALEQLGAEHVIDYTSERLEELEPVDAVLNLVGGDTLQLSYSLVKPGGVAITANRPPDEEEARRRGIKARFVETNVTTESLNKLAELIVAGEVKPQIAAVETLWAPSTLWEEKKREKVGKVVFSVQS